ncbi:tripartite tricarboxylate transporter TctB family protein [Pararhizobium sp. IMCC21322]|uniref:tripartite tricarboxylate transporter TctB family protein n=1 Tax=Pararhizobium sp. IMCC21322 TaxID=3067903 RepID=UPI0027411DD1|nr:tripartite tricarboxylate transporter TctB family protein [Pararhizobium sp. IMCC21322]
MLKRDHFDALCGFLILAIAAYLLLEASKINAPAHVYPLVILTIVIALSAVSTVSAVRRVARSRSRSAANASDKSEPPKSLKIWGILIAVILYAFGMQFDYTLSTGAFLFVMFLTLGPGPIAAARIIKSLLMAVAMTTFLYLAFAVWLNVSVPNIFQ